MQDLISRKQAVDALRKMQTYKLFSGDDMLLIDQAGAQTELMLLPPAQPEIVRCKDCKHWFPHTQCGFDEDNDEYHDYCGLLIPEDDYYAYTRKPGDYCSYGKRREEGGEK